VIVAKSSPTLPRVAFCERDLGGCVAGVSSEVHGPLANLPPPGYL
jgi:hypothetical protein